MYDEPIRFNVTLVDDAVCVAQPYLPATRGVDSPTFVIHERWAGVGLFHVFDRLVADLLSRARAL